MESLKEKIPMIIAVVVAIAICVAILYFFENYESAYFTQIDNTKIEKLSSTDDMKYKYTLECYNEKGKKKELKFKTSRELKEELGVKAKEKDLQYITTIKSTKNPKKLKIYWRFNFKVKEFMINYIQ